VRTAEDPNALREAFRRALKQIDPDVPAAAVRTMDEALDIGMAPRRMNLWLVRVFAGLSLLLAAAGVYAVTTFTIALRRREIAIRAALGASLSHTVRTIVVDAVRPVVAGLIAGAAGAFIVSPALRAVLFEVEPLAVGPFTLVSTTLLVAGVVSAIAAAVPVRRIDAIEALRVESR
jgi:putative ABC transport system permease protein